MKSAAILLIWISTCLADSSKNQPPKAKNPITGDSVPSAPKPEAFYQPVEMQPQPQYLPLYQKPSYVPHQPHPHAQQPVAMIIIAQPALVPQHLLQGNMIQTLLQYFQGNPNARYSLVYGQTPRGVEAYTAPSPITSQTVGSYQVVSPFSQYQPQYQQYQSQMAAAAQTSPQVFGYRQASLAGGHSHPGAHYSSGQPHQPYPLSQIAKLAQMTAQQVSSGQLRSAPAIVTGLEKFSPEQQAKIKEQLNRQFGSTITASSEEDTEESSPKQYEERSPKTSMEFIPSPEVKGEDANEYQPSSHVYRIHRFSKG